MKCAVLLSGGKDSVASCWKAMEKGEEISCFITIQSKNAESYMFHTPNISLTRILADASGIPLIEQVTEGAAEEELTDLRIAIMSAMDRFQIEAVITGAIRSVYQASRVERICHELGLWCFSPLWLCDEEEYLRDLVCEGFEIMIVGVFAGPFGEEWLGRMITPDTIDELVSLREKYSVSVAGEGGEYESFVCNAPFFNRRIIIHEGIAEYHRDHGKYQILKAGYTP